MSSMKKHAGDLEHSVSKTELCHCTNFIKEELTYTWSIKQFCDLLDRKYEFLSPIFATGAQSSGKWRIALFQELCYPKGFSLSMILAKMSKYSARHAVQYSVFIIDKNGKHVLLQTREKVFRYYSDADEFLLISHFELKENGLLQSNGTLDILCKMDILFTENEDEPELEYLSNSVTQTVTKNSNINNLLTKTSVEKAKNLKENKLSSGYVSELNVSKVDSKQLNVFNDTSPKVKSEDPSLKYLSDHFKSLYMTKSFYDITVCVDGTEMRSHKAILSARSNYFRKACEVAVNNKISVSGIKSATLEAIIYYLYTGQMRHLTPELARDLLPASRKLGISYIEKLVIEFLQNHMNANNVADILQLAEEMKLGDLRHSALKFLSL